MGNMNSGRPKRRGAAEIASMLRRNIMAGELALRERLAPERTLAAEYRVARGTVREALNQLASEELVQIRPGSGTYVTYEASNLPNPVMLSAGPDTLLDARQKLEPLLCALAASNRRQQDVDDLIALSGKYLTAGDVPAQADADAEFHELIAKASGNEVLAWVVNQLHGARHQEPWAGIRRFAAESDLAVEHMQQHRQIVDAIHRRDTAQARQLMFDHIEAERLLVSNGLPTASLA